MKKKKIVTVVVIIFILGVLLRSAMLYVGYMYPDKAYFGEQYIQIIYPTTIGDYIIAGKVLKDADEAFSAFVTSEQAEEKYGALGRYCITHQDAVSEKHDIDFIAADFDDNTGYMWIKYSQEAHDDQKELTYGSWGILARWELEKVNGEWKVITTKEHP